jgi:acyl-CoA dehydrogenase
MDFTLNERETYWRDRVRDFINIHLIPATPTFVKQANEGERWKVIPIMEEMKAKAKAAGIWNLFMPPSSGFPHVDDSVHLEGPGLTNMEYSLCAEEMGRLGWSSEVFNCSAPDTGNMEVFNRYGTREQKLKYMVPLMNGEIRSAFLMTEPAVASSDATNIETAIRRDGDDYVINGTLQGGHRHGQNRFRGQAPCPAVDGARRS